MSYREENGQVVLTRKIESAMQEAERKAWDSLARYKFQMFGYWAAIWVHLNHIAGTRLPNPFRLLVANAREAVAPHKHQDDCELLASVHTAINGPAVEEVEL
jgi:hypothetical protein